MGAASALLALIAACGPGEAAVKAPKDTVADSGETTAANEGSEAAAETSKDSRSLKPGLARLDTGVDLSKLEFEEDDVVPAPEESKPDTAKLAATNSVNLTAPAATTPQDETGELPPGHATILGEERHDFGSIVQGTHATNTFRLISDGENDLVISRIKPSCGCTVAQVNLVLDDGTRKAYTTGDAIPPGTEFEIEAAFKSDGKQGRTKTQVAVYCNDPRTVLSLMLEADVQPVLVLEPRTLQLGTATSADKVEGSLRLSSPTLPAYKVEVDEQFIQKNMTVELKPVDPDAEGRAKEWDIHVTLGPELPEGMRNYPIRLTTDQLIPSPRGEHDDHDDHAGHDHDDGKTPPKYYFVIGYAQVQVKGLVSANPAYVPFGMVRPGQEVERVVRIECHDDFELSADTNVAMTALIQSDLFDYRKAFTTKLDPVEGENALDLTVKLEGLPDGVSGSFGGMLRLDVNHPNKKELMVRFSGVCRPGVVKSSQGSESGR